MSTEEREGIFADPRSHIKGLMKAVLYLEERAQYAGNDEGDYFRLAVEALVEEIILTAHLCGRRLPQ